MMIGAALVLLGDNLLVVTGIGLGMIIYGFTLVFYTLLSWWRIRRSAH
jgi:hypothetical protein